MSITVTYQDKIAILNLGADENRFSLGFLDEINSAIDDLMAGGAQGLVTTGAGKFYSNGLDLDWLMAHADQMQWYVGQVHALFARVLTLPVPTAAAVNGHAFGAGAMLAMAHDYRTMRSDRGFFCFPEVDIRIPFTPGMAALIQAKLTPQAAIASMTTGRRFGGDDAAKYGLVDAAAAEDAVTTAAVELVTPVAGKDSETMGAIKSTMFGPAIAALRAE
ncbi:MAG: enoyl-CoA hydratase-related protein [Mycobacterium sp.]|nr:enoyl-CoA hydratase-related protein [Mycobacterium sp.]